MSRMTCEGCGLVYSRTAIVREMALATGIACRRCGGTLKAEGALPHRGRRQPVQAVRAAAYGLERQPSGRLAVDVDGDGTRPSPRGTQR